MSTTELLIKSLHFNCNFNLEKLQLMEDNFESSYNEKSKHLIDTLDFNKLAEVKKKVLKDLTEEDLHFIGFEKRIHEDFENFYSFEDLDHVKVYVNRVHDKFELRGYLLKKIKEINTTTELLDETLTKWKLNL